MVDQDTDVQTSKGMHIGLKIFIGIIILVLMVFIYYGAVLTFIMRKFSKKT